MRNNQEFERETDHAASFERGRQLSHKGYSGIAVEVVVSALLEQKPISSYSPTLGTLSHYQGMLQGKLELLEKETKTK